ncbi:MAG: hypothetical protein M3377_09345 [Actinomycetota bacterium]|nr:hypothetical protein [Actinomycetota bacterium]
MRLELDSIFQLGDPVEHRGVTIAPLFPRRQPVAEYVTLDDALPLGFRVAEIDAAGAVPQLLVENPLDGSVLLYDGEELVGAKQNRILNVTVLVAAQASVRIPVSCVEAGRWSARSAAFAAARHTANPELRRRKAESLLVEPNALGIAQSEVWDAVAEKADRLGTHSPTGAQADIFTAREDDLAALRRAFPLQAGQSGAVLALGDELVCLDYASRPDAFARVYPKLLDGYLLDGVEQLDREPTDVAALAGFVSTCEKVHRATRPSVGLGDDVRLHGDRIVGSGLTLEDELLQLSAYAVDPGLHPESSIARPTRRG